MNLSMCMYFNYLVFCSRIFFVWYELAGWNYFSSAAYVSLNDLRLEKADLDHGSNKNRVPCFGAKPWFVRNFCRQSYLCLPTNRSSNVRVFMTDIMTANLLKNFISQHMIRFKLLI